MKKKKKSSNSYAKQEAKLFIDYFANASPEIIPQTIMERKWSTEWFGYLDKTRGFLDWVADSPETEKATALLLVWCYGPTFRRLFNDVEEYVEITGNYWSYYFGERIEQKYIDGFYTVSNLAFDPNTDPETVRWEEKYKNEILVKPPVPTVLYEKIEGKTVEPPTDFISGMPSDLYAQWKEFENLYDVYDSPYRDVFKMSDYTFTKDEFGLSIPTERIHISAFSRTLEVWFDTHSKRQKKPTVKQWKTLKAFRSIDDSEIEKMEKKLNQYYKKLLKKGRIEESGQKKFSLFDLDLEYRNVILPKQQMTNESYLIVLANTSWKIHDSEHIIELEILFKNNRFELLQEMTGLWTRIEWYYWYNVKE